MATIHNFRKHKNTHLLYYKWLDLKRRCYCKKYKRFNDWGGRGIQVCDEWKNDPKAFIDWSLAHGYKDGLAIDRINNDGNYEPSNCRFVTILVNNNNRRIPKKLSNLPEGVQYNGKKYQARISIYDQRINLGTWSTQEEASKQYECIKRIYILSLESK